MESSIDHAIEQMSAPEILEAAIMALPPAFNIDDLEEGVGRVIELADLPDSAAKELHAMMIEASNCRDEVVDMLKLVIPSAAEEGLVDREAINMSLESVGQKQIAISPEIFQLAVLLIGAYFIVVTKGRKEVNTEITFEEDKNGRKKLSIKHRIIYLNPFSPLVAWIDRLLKQGANGTDS